MSVEMTIGELRALVRELQGCPGSSPVLLSQEDGFVGVEQPSMFREFEVKTDYAGYVSIERVRG